MGLSVRSNSASDGSTPRSTALGGAGAGGAGEVKSNVDGDFEYVTTQLKEYLTSHLVDSYIARKASDLVRPGNTM